ncbi:hypothetical protein [Catellatospora citrea]|uniref:DNA-directed RNA polymerase specialized sigma24 family protein n=1 Tax=Catellatospora citrea TaxID=53366 RepID=A0A8J3NYF0_9ACTN|nr:hypothetical protein [Catellatospora citrea]RKE09447.1 hypothetical protein C8E86_4334 [Catellatospora citrea]GIF97405.1 hypothetical protein Cci01nite_24990 [Catellatospora citrea]
MTSSDYREFQQIWQPRIAAEIYAYTGDRDAAAEIAQEVFGLAGSRWTRLEQQEDPIRWARQEAWQRVDERWLGTARPHGDQSGPAMVAALAALDPATRRTVVLLLADVPSHEYAALGATDIPAAQWDDALEYLAASLPGQDPATLFAQLCTGWEITVPRSRAKADKPRARSHSLAPSRRPRRTRTLVALGTVGLLVAGVVVATKWAADPAGGIAAPEVSASAPADSPEPDPSATEDPAPTPSGTAATPSPGPSASRARPTPTPSRSAASPRPGNPPTASPTGPPSPSPSPPCQVSVDVTATGPGSGGALQFAADPVGGRLEFCGTQRAVWWASYTLGDDGVLHLARSGTRNLDRDAPSWSTAIESTDCDGAWYYGRNEVSFPADIALSARDDAFGSDKMGSSPAGNACF